MKTGATHPRSPRRLVFNPRTQTRWHTAASGTGRPAPGAWPRRDRRAFACTSLRLRLEERSQQRLLAGRRRPAERQPHRIAGRVGRLLLSTRPANASACCDQEIAVEQRQRLRRHRRLTRGACSWSRSPADRRPAAASTAASGAPAGRSSGADPRGVAGDDNLTVAMALHRHRRAEHLRVERAAGEQDRVAQRLGLQAPQPLPPQQAIVGIDLAGLVVQPGWIVDVCARRWRSGSAGASP